MENNKKFVITYTKLNGESVTTEAKGTDQYRMATDKITDWKIKWN